MNYHDGPKIIFISAFSFAEDTIFLQQYFVTGLIIPVYMGIASLSVLLFVCCCLYSLIFDQSARHGPSNNTSHPKLAAPGEVLSTV
jgi:hypothetical protein